MVSRGEVWLVNLDPTVGSEIRKSRPCVVISPPELNEHLKTVIVAPHDFTRISSTVSHLADFSRHDRLGAS